MLDPPLSDVFWNGSSYAGAFDKIFQIAEMEIYAGATMKFNRFSKYTIEKHLKLNNHVLFCPRTSFLEFPTAQKHTDE